MNKTRKKVKQGGEDLENPYEQIPEIPNVHLTLKDMNSDPI